MKISIKDENKVIHKRSITIKCNDYVNMREIAEVFAGACVAYGFTPETVKKYVYSEMLDGSFKGDEV